jgi:hypothetical protein
LGRAFAGIFQTKQLKTKTMKKTVLIVIVLALGVSADYCLWCGPAQRAHERMYQKLSLQKETLAFYPEWKAGKS